MSVATSFADVTPTPHTSPAATQLSKALHLECGPGVPDVIGATLPAYRHGDALIRLL